VDFEPSARTRDLLDRLQVFMDEHVYPAEQVYDAQIAAAANRHEQPPVMRELQAKARERGLWNLFMTHGSWGAGLTNLYSMYSTTDIPAYLGWFFGTPWDQAAIYRKLSPIEQSSTATSGVSARTLLATSVPARVRPMVPMAPRAMRREPVRAVSQSPRNPPSETPAAPKRYGRLPTRPEVISSSPRPSLR